MTYEEIIRFHGHSCPGLAIGFRMSMAAMGALASIRAEDEELVAIVENDACGVDALQCVTGCTFGKGNLLFRDYGKHVYTVYSRQSRQGVRVLFHAKDVPDDIREDRERFSEWILTAPEESVVDVSIVRIDAPEPARIMASEPCDACGEAVMQSRLRSVADRTVCIPCSEAMHAH